MHTKTLTHQRKYLLTATGAAVVVVVVTAVTVSLTYDRMNLRDLPSAVRASRDMAVWVVSEMMVLLAGLLRRRKRENIK